MSFTVDASLEAKIKAQTDFLNAMVQVMWKRPEGGRASRLRSRSLCGGHVVACAAKWRSV